MLVSKSESNSQYLIIPHAVACFFSERKKASTQPAVHIMKLLLKLKVLVVKIN